MKKFVIISYSITGSAGDQIIKENIKQLGAWMNYFPGSFIIVTNYDIESIYNKIKTNVPADRFLILDIDLKNYFGILPKEAWDWMEQRKKEVG